MIKKYFAFLLSVLIVACGLTLPGSAKAQAGSHEEKTRAKVQSLSVNRDQKVEVRLRDKTKWKGYITSVESDSFTLTGPNTAKSQKFSYAEVEDVKKAAGGVSTKTWLIIGGIAAGTVATWLIVKPAVCDGGAQTRGIC